MPPVPAAYLGSLFFFMALIFLIIVCASAPASHSIGFMKVVLQYSDGTTYGHVMFGIFGYCSVGTELNDGCWKTWVAYDIVEYGGFIGYQSSGTLQTTLHVLTGFLVLYPISAGISFVACLTALAVHHIGFGSSVFFALVACVLAFLALVITFVLFTIFQHLPIAYDNVHARFSNATWLALVAFCFLVIGTIMVFCDWLAERRKRYNVYMYPPQETAKTTTSWVNPQQEMIAGSYSPQPTHSTIEALSRQPALIAR